MKFKTITTAFLAMGLLVGSASVMAPRANAEINLDVIIGTPPPAPRVERAPERREGFIWIPGYWRWEGNHHVWSDGRWEPERRGYEYRPAHWDHEGDRWHFREGSWVAKEHREERREENRDERREHDRDR
ncbi:MAG: hypothetical protein JWM78_3684 [Verrucomicrobiaceae bacterium]|nr:hypothetical protein [Verrucomicrobiaceae bacterium]